MDRDGCLHLKLTQRGRRWYCAEVYTRKALGFGLYQFQIAGRVDRLDPNVVFGLFNYPQPEIGPDGTNEIDIEFARWGEPSAPIGNYTVWPTRAALKQTTRNFDVSLSGEGPTTHSFAWSPASVLFRSVAGRQEDHSQPLGNWHYQPRDPTTASPISPCRSTSTCGFPRAPAPERPTGPVGCPFVQVHAETRRHAVASSFTQTDPVTTGGRNPPASVPSPWRGSGSLIAAIALPWGRSQHFRQVMLKARLELDGDHRRRAADAGYVHDAGLDAGCSTMAATLSVRSSIRRWPVESNELCS